MPAFLLRAAGIALAAGFLACVAGGAAPAAPAKIGVAAAVQNDVQGIVGGNATPLAAGAHVFQDETVKTGAKSMAQLLFIDETTLSVGPNSDITLDRFVYDPGRGTGDVVLSATRGAFRFITGSQNPRNYKINTAVASIGVRGTIFDGYAGAQGLIVIAQEGRVIVDVGGKTFELKPGQMLFVDAGGVPHGPMAPDGHFFDVVGIAPFELFGAFLPGDHEQVVVPDGSTQRLDELFPHGGGDNECYPLPYCY